MSIDGRINVDVLFHDKSTGSLSSQLRVDAATYSLPLTDGTGVNQAQLVWSSSATNTGTAADEWILQSLSDSRGSVSFTAIKAVYVRNKSSTQRLTVTADNWTTIDPVLLPWNLLIPAGGVCLYTNPTADGWTTGGGSALSIISEGDGQSVDYDILLVGEGTVS